MLLLLQIALYCLLYILLVKLAVKNDGINCLFFYPKEYCRWHRQTSVRELLTAEPSLCQSVRVSSL